MKTPFHLLTLKQVGTTKNSRLQFTADRPLAEFLQSLEASSQIYVNASCCLRHYTKHSNFAQILNFYIRKWTS